MKIEIEFSTSNMIEIIYIKNKIKKQEICKSFLDILSIDTKALNTAIENMNSNDINSVIETIKKIKNTEQLLLLGDYTDILKWFEIKDTNISIKELESYMNKLIYISNDTENYNLNSTLLDEIENTKRYIRHLKSFSRNRNKFIKTTLNIILTKIELYKNIVNACFINDSSLSNEEIIWSNLEPLKKFYIYTEVLEDKSNFLKNIPIASIIFNSDLKYNKQDIEKINVSEFMPTYKYSCKTLDDLLQISLVTALLNNFKIKKCTNCNKYFIAQQRIDEKYCNRISPQNAEKTCKQYAINENWKTNLQNNECLLLYRQIYMKKQMQAKRNPENISLKNNFNNWKKEAKHMRNMYTHNIISKENFLNWLKNTSI